MLWRISGFREDNPDAVVTFHEAASREEALVFAQREWIVWDSIQVAGRLPTDKRVAWRSISVAVAGITVVSIASTWWLERRISAVTDTNAPAMQVAASLSSPPTAAKPRRHLPLDSLEDATNFYDLAFRVIRGWSVEQRFVSLEPNRRTSLPTIHPPDTTTVITISVEAVNDEIVATCFQRSGNRPLERVDVDAMSQFHELISSDRDQLDRAVQAFGALDSDWPRVKHQITIDMNPTWRAQASADDLLGMQSFSLIFVRADAVDRLKAN